MLFCCYLDDVVSKNRKVENLEKLKQTSDMIVALLNVGIRLCISG